MCSQHEDDRNSRPQILKYGPTRGLRKRRDSNEGLSLGKNQQVPPTILIICREVAAEWNRQHPGGNVQA